jgi:hypothetical protein
MPVTKRALIIVLLAGAAGYISPWGHAAGPPSAAAASSCPAKLPAAVSSARTGARLELVPAGARSLLLCSYHGLNPASTAGELERTRRVRSAAELDWLVRTFNALPARTGLSGCPMDDGSATLALFGYSTAPIDEVSVGLTGCRVVQNGYLTRTASLTPGPALLARLASLLG